MYQSEEVWAVTDEVKKKKTIKITNSQKNFSLLYIIITIITTPHRYCQ
jgi:hypothetical protein